ncbi:VOC family protein [Desulfosporosinus orientis]|nr:VOC family protein [Desulfosporosinus orientis]
MIDHLVLTVRDVDSSCEFYSQVLGMDIVFFGEGRKALAFGDQKINLHELGKEFEPKARKPTPGAADLCFITEVPLGDVIKKLTRRGLAIAAGPVKRAGACGNILSVYLYDPDGNLIELVNYL